MGAPLFPNTISEEAVERVRRALQFEIAPVLSDEEARERAEALIAIAVHFSVPVDPVLLQWIHFTTPGKLWSGAEWRRWCEKYTESQKALEALGAIEGPPPAARCGHCGQAIHSDVQAREHRCRLMCPNCTAQEMSLHGELWVCGNCGEVAGGLRE